MSIGHVNPVDHGIDIYAVYVATKYEGVYEQLVRSYKFDLKRQAAEPMAAIMLQLPVRFEATSILCSVPTAPSRIRQRGFDHMRLLAQSVWRRLPSEAQAVLQLKEVLDRKSNVRQLGSVRAQRVRQMESEFFVKDESIVAGKTVVLLDDVTTTGASLAAAAKTLKAAGAKRVYALVFAQKV